MLFNGTISQAGRSGLTRETCASDEKNNFNFISIRDISDIQYTYEQSGKTYYVKESTNYNASRIDTRIFEVVNEKKILVDEFYTEFEVINDTIVFNKIKNDSIVDRFTFNLYGDKINEGINVVSTDSDTYDGFIYYDGSTGKYYTSWYYAYSFSGDNKFIELTVSAVAIILSAISDSPVTIIIIGIASELVKSNIDTVYYDKDVYQVHQITYPERRYYGTPIGVRTCVDYYYDKAKKLHIDYTESEWHDPEEWPTAITIK